jgi:four helix bundle protein
MEETYEAWVETVPAAMTSDLLWRLDVVRCSTWFTTLAMQDAGILRASGIGFRVADQLMNAAGSISANLWEGLGRSSAMERSRFATYALGSARETMAWYVAVREALPPARFDHRMELCARIRNMLVALLRNLDRRIQRTSGFGGRDRN